MTYFKKGLILLVALNLTGADDIVFQYNITDQSKLPSDGRIPLLNVEGCDENEIYYPGDQDNDWICDCKPTYVYMPDRDKCYPLYSRGPCDEDHYVILAKDSAIPICKLNTCFAYNKVLYNKTCISLGGPCGDFNHGIYEVDEVSLEIKCNMPTYLQEKAHQRTKASPRKK